VMYAGRIVEKGPVAEIFAEPRHPYTRGLLESLPRVDRRTDKLHPIEGTVPAPDQLPQGCAFEPRCRYALEECKRNQPLLESDLDGRALACFNPQLGSLEQ
jgi:peptide/nickel transport system ATP-binding protein